MFKGEDGREDRGKLHGPEVEGEGEEKKNKSIVRVKKEKLFKLPPFPPPPGPSV